MSFESNMLTILVTSCDKYSDLWAPFSQLFNKYWSDCPYPVYLITESPNETTPEFCFDKVIPCGKVGWGDRLSMALEQVETPYVMLLCDDYFLCDRVDSGLIAHYVNLAQKYNAGNLRLIPNPKHTRIFSSEANLGEYDKKTAYCIATQAGIWDTIFLTRLAKGYNSIWEFERLGSFRPDLTQPLLGTLDIQFPFEDVVHKGKWEHFGIRLCLRNGIQIDGSRRQALSDIDYVREHLKGAVLALNPTLVVKFQNLLGLGKK
jgi:hypothetical protein